MKRYILISLLFLSFNNSWCQSEKTSKLKLNSVEIDYFLSNNLTNSTKYDIKNYYLHSNDYVSVIPENFSNNTNKVSSTIGDMNFSFCLGFKPYSKNKKSYLNRQELVFGIYNGYFMKNNYFKSNTINNVIDIVNTLSINTSGDTIYTDTSYLVKNNDEVESYYFSGNKITIFSEWYFKTKTDKRLILSFAPGVRFSYIYKTYVGYGYKKTDMIYTTKDTLNIYNYDHIISGNTYQNDNYKKRGKNGISVEPYLKANIELRMSMRDNFFNHLSFNFYGYSGVSFNQIFETKLDKTFLYGLGTSIKYIF
jgi:hypothetical protein